MKTVVIVVAAFVAALLIFKDSRKTEDVKQEELFI